MGWMSGKVAWEEGVEDGAGDRGEGGHRRGRGLTSSAYLSLAFVGAGASLWDMSSHSLS